MLSKYKPFIEARLAGLAQSLKWVNPNALTVLGIIPPVLFFIFLQSQSFIWAAIALLLSGIDMLDGLVARAAGKVSAFGGFLDSSVDRVSDFLIIAAFYAAGLVRLEITAILLLVTFLISYVRSRAELASMGKLRFDQGLVERPERILFLFAVVALKMIFPKADAFGMSLSEFLVSILLVLSVYTLIERVFYAYRRL
jgi:archaetidylinositol phosphate synthase